MRYSVRGLVLQSEELTIRELLGFVEELEYVFKDPVISILYARVESALRDLVTHPIFLQEDLQNGCVFTLLLRHLCDGPAGTLN